MPVDRRTAENFFQRKLPGAERIDGARHVGYRIISSEGIVLLPVLTVSRGASGGDLDTRNVKGLADDMGLSLEGFTHGCKCRLTADVVAFCAAVRVVLHCAMLHNLDKIAFNIDMIRSAERVTKSWLSSIETGKNRRLTGQERKELQRSARRLMEVGEGDHFTEIVGFLNAYIKNRFNLDVT